MSCSYPDCNCPYAGLKSDGMPLVCSRELMAPGAPDLAQLRDIFGGQDPEEPPQIWPLSWLESAIQELTERGPAPENDDPGSFWEMVSEVRAIHAKAAARLLPDNSADAEKKR